MTSYKGVPEGASAIIPRLVCRDVEAEIEFCCKTFGAVEGVRRPGPDGKVTCSYCGRRVTKKDSFGASYVARQVWHTACGSGPARPRLSERELFRGYGVEL